MSFEHYTILMDKFSSRQITLPRPQKTFMYIKENGFNIPNRTELFYEIYFTPECNIYMRDLIDEYHFTFCERPERESVIGLCTIKDFEDAIWD